MGSGELGQARWFPGSGRRALCTASQSPGFLLDAAPTSLNCLCGLYSPSRPSYPATWACVSQLLHCKTPKAGLEHGRHRVIVNWIKFNLILNSVNTVGLHWQCNHEQWNHSESESRSVVSCSLPPQGLQPSRLLCPWDSPSKNTGVGSHSLLQGIFPTKVSNPHLLHCRQIPYCLSHAGSWAQTLFWQS